MKYNNPAEIAEIYYKINFYYPFLDHVLSELAARSSNHHKNIGNLQILRPTFMKNKNDAKIKLTEMISEKLIFYFFQTFSFIFNFSKNVTIKIVYSHIVT